ncbi:class E sortase [Streptomyces sp. NBC_00239]|uniref:class E sortase n=1 Tax=Streptomyces sp. NBC_00239 TaxID=2903640 RepID=UPI002E2DC39E|nr:class E sortase [Streptomyces sp. NBC_00239]
MRERIPVVVQGQRRRPSRGRVLARGLWSGAELAVTAGLVLLLLVVHQLWWTNREARAGARDQVRALERQWAADAGGGGGAGAGGVVPEAPEASAGAGEGGGFDPGAGAGAGAGGDGAGDGSPGPAASGGPPRSARPQGRTPAAPRWDQAYAVLRIPRLGVVAPVAQGVSKRGVLDKGYVGHYAGTAQPGRQGNFALAGHRNTHGEPFRYINRLRAGDELIVDVRGRRFTYVVGRRLEQTSARDGGVIASVPRSVVHPRYGYDEPGFYITLTTCTPEYTSKYRLVVWGTLVSSAER